MHTVAPKLHSAAGVRKKKPENERRQAQQGDRRKNSRGGRRNGDPHSNWRRIAWLFAAYAMYLSVRSVPATVRRMLQRKNPA